MSPELSKYVTSYVIGLPTSSEKRFYGEDRKPYSVSCGFHGYNGYEYVLPMSRIC